MGIYMFTHKGLTYDKSKQWLNCKKEVMGTLRRGASSCYDYYDYDDDYCDTMIAVSSPSGVRGEALAENAF